MSREIKFRAWDKEERKWKLGYKELGGFHLLGELNLLGEVNAELASPLSKLQDIEIMQYTGLKDINGKGIYEEDIIGFGKRKFIVKYVTEMGQLFANEITTPKDLGDTYGMVKSEEWGGTAEIRTEEDCEVIGNIYENPELLEKKK